jgi:hypothetical protein
LSKHNLASKTPNPEASFVKIMKILWLNFKLFIPIVEFLKVELNIIPFLRCFPLC